MDNFKKPKTWADIQNDGRVAKAYIDSDGRWVELKPGYKFFGETGCVTGTTASLIDDFYFIEEVKKD